MATGPFSHVPDDELVRRVAGSSPTDPEVQAERAELQARGLSIRDVEPAERAGHSLPQQVVIKDIEMNFWSMVAFMVKWSIAAIPAFIVLFLVAFVLAAFFRAMLSG